MAKPESKPKQANIFIRIIGWIDTLQRRRRAIGFPYAIVKKYGDDDMGHQAALITYYGFLSLFPLLIVATSVIDLLAQHDAHMRAKLLGDINSYFPIVGEQLQQSVHGKSKSGVALAIGVVVALYGARGIADAVRSALDHAWAVPKVRRSGFPINTLKSIGLLVGAGFGLLFTAGLASFATAAVGHSWALRAIPVAINIALLYIIFMYTFLIGTSRAFPRKDLRIGAITAAVGLLLLQTLGGYLITHQLHNLQGLYGQFALVLAILFWIYLQAQVFTYAIEINVVHTYKLWPRSLAGDLTHADEHAYRMYAEKEAYRKKPQENIAVTFSKP